MNNITKKQKSQETKALIKHNLQNNYVLNSLQIRDRLGESKKDTVHNQARLIKKDNPKLITIYTNLLSRNKDGRVRAALRGALYFNLKEDNKFKEICEGFNVRIVDSGMHVFGNMHKIYALQKALQKYCNPIKIPEIFQKAYDNCKVFVYERLHSLRIFKRKENDDLIIKQKRYIKKFILHYNINSSFLLKNKYSYSLISKMKRMIKARKLLLKQKEEYFFKEIKILIKNNKLTVPSNINSLIQNEMEEVTMAVFGFLFDEVAKVRQEEFLKLLRNSAIKQKERFESIKTDIPQKIKDLKEKLKNYRKYLPIDAYKQMFFAYRDLRNIAYKYKYQIEQFFNNYIDEEKIEYEDKKLSLKEMLSIAKELKVSHEIAKECGFKELNKTKPVIKKISKQKTEMEKIISYENDWKKKKKRLAEETVQLFKPENFNTTQHKPKLPLIEEVKKVEKTPEKPKFDNSYSHIKDPIIRAKILQQIENASNNKLLNNILKTN